MFHPLPAVFRVALFGAVLLAALTLPNPFAAEDPVPQGVTAVAEELAQKRSRDLAEIIRVASERGRYCPKCKHVRHKCEAEARARAAQAAAEARRAATLAKRHY